MEQETQPANSGAPVPEDDSLAPDEAAAAVMDEMEARETDKDSPRDSSSTAQSTGMPAGTEGGIANQLHAEANIICMFFSRDALLRIGSSCARAHNRRRPNTAPRLGRQGLTFSSPPHVPRVRYILAYTTCNCCV